MLMTGWMHGATECMVAYTCGHVRQCGLWCVCVCVQENAPIPIQIPYCVSKAQMVAPVTFQEQCLTIALVSILYG